LAGSVSAQALADLLAVQGERVQAAVRSVLHPCVVELAKDAPAHADHGWLRWQEDRGS
jgi:hypothetical protein